MDRVAPNASVRTARYSLPATRYFRHGPRITRMGTDATGIRHRLPFPSFNLNLPPQLARSGVASRRPSTSTCHLNSPSGVAALQLTTSTRPSGAARPSPSPRYSPGNSSCFFPYAVMPLSRRLAKSHLYFRDFGTVTNSDSCAAIKKWRRKKLPLGPRENAAFVSKQSRLIP